MQLWLNERSQLGGAAPLRTMTGGRQEIQTPRPPRHPAADTVYWNHFDVANNYDGYGAKCVGRYV